MKLKQEPKSESPKSINTYQLFVIALVIVIYGRGGTVKAAIFDLSADWRLGSSPVNQYS